MQRFGMILNASSLPEGTFPVLVVPLPIVQVCCSLWLLLALREELPESLPNGRVRAAMTAVIKRMFSPANFNEKVFCVLASVHISLT